MEGVNRGSGKGGWILTGRSRLTGREVSKSQCGHRGNVLGSYRIVCVDNLWGDNLPLLVGGHCGCELAFESESLFDGGCGRTLKLKLGDENRLMH